MTHVDQFLFNFLFLKRSSSIYINPFKLILNGALFQIETWTQFHFLSIWNPNRSQIREDGGINDSGYILPCESEMDLKDRKLIKV